MQKHFKSMTDVVLMTTTPPDWYIGKYIPFTDVPDKPATSILRKMLGAGVEDFLWCADDHFAVRDFDIDLPNYYNKHRHRVGVSLRGMLSNCLPDWLNYVVHAPMIINRTKLQQAVEWAGDREYPIKTLYANYNKLPGVPMTDCKFRDRNSYTHIKAMIKRQPFFSTHENAILPDMFRVLNELYPLPSLYEKK